MARRLLILGSTGSVGRNALEVVRRHRDRFEVVGLGARSNAQLLAEQAAEFRPKWLAIVDEKAGKQLKGCRRSLSPDTQVLTGQEGFEELAGVRADMALTAIVGAAGLKPLLRTIEAGNAVALANKEALVMAGPLVMERARAHEVELVPVDSEHSAIFQCLNGRKREEVRCIYLTASGGPFYGRPRESLASVTPEEAMRHPTWEMGKKVSVDSATLMNKGLEILEAMWLFELPAEKIQVVMHPQSLVHGLVEFTDGNILAHLGLADMRFPIEFALTWPERVASPMARLDLTKGIELTFAAPDLSIFPCLGYAIEAAKRGGTAPAVLNAANESAVEAFCRRRILFPEIPEVVSHVLNRCPTTSEVTLESVLAADQEARRTAEAHIETLRRSR